MSVSQDGLHTGREQAAAAPTPRGDQLATARTPGCPHASSELRIPNYRAPNPSTRRIRATARAPRRGSESRLCPHSRDSECRRLRLRPPTPTPRGFKSSWPCFRHSRESRPAPIRETRPCRLGVPPTVRRPGAPSRSAGQSPRRGRSSAGPAGPLSRYDLRVSCRALPPLPRESPPERRDCAVIESERRNAVIAP